MQRRWGMWAGIALGGGLVAWGLRRARRLGRLDDGAERLDEARSREVMPAAEPEAEGVSALRSESDAPSPGM